MEMRMLTKSETAVLYEQFPDGRMSDFLSPVSPGGVSYVAGIANCLASVGMAEKIPEWVRGDYEEALRELRGKALLLPFASRISIGIGTGPDYGIIEDGSAIMACAKEGHMRILVVLSKDGQSWLVAAWDGVTGDPMLLPQFGSLISIPIRDIDPEAISRKRNAAIKKAELDLRAMRKADRNELLSILLAGFLTFAVLFVLAWWRG